jgi:hypothetical protein
MVAGIGFGGPRELIPIIMESGEVDGVILLGIGWHYSMVDAVNAKVDYLTMGNEEVRKRFEHEIKYSDLLADYARQWEKPLLMTSAVARLAVRRKYHSLVRLLEQGIMIYPTIEDVVKAFSYLADRYYFLKREGE